MRTGMRFGGGLVFSLALLAQAPQPPGIVRGKLIEVDSDLSGELSIRAPDNQVFRFRFDRLTYVERDERRISMARLQKGDNLEIVSDLPGGAQLRYARTIHVIETPVKPRPTTAFYRPYRTTIDDLFPRGNLTFSGVIAQINDVRMVLRTRADGEKTIYLRQDTRYLYDGSAADLAALKPNTRIFVRAGTNLDNEIEAFQVVWGEILKPAQ